MRRITAVVVAGAAAMICGCEGSGSPTAAADTLQCQTLQQSQNTNNWTNCLSWTNGGAGSGGGTSSAGEAPAALYRLVRVNGAAIPFLMDSDSVTVAGDSSRVINIVLDSSIISLNTDSTVTQIDYFNIRDYRLSHVNNTPPAHSINWLAISFPDTSTGVWSDSSGQPEIELLTGRVSNIGYLYSGDTLTANYAYNFTDTSGTTISGVAYFTYQNEGASFHQVVKKRPNAVLRASSTTPSPIRQSSIGGAGLGFMRSDDGSGRFVRVIGQ